MSAPAADPPPAAEPDAPPQQTPARPGRRSRVGTVFSAWTAGALVLALLLIFILENTETVKVNFLGAGGRLSLGLALLVAAVGGALATGLVGLARVAQLRLLLRRGRSR